MAKVVKTACLPGVQLFYVPVTVGELLRAEKYRLFHAVNGVIPRVFVQHCLHRAFGAHGEKTHLATALAEKVQRVRGGFRRRAVRSYAHAYAANFQHRRDVRGFVLLPAG